VVGVLLSEQGENMFISIFGSSSKSIRLILIFLFLASVIGTPLITFSDLWAGEKATINNCIKLAGLESSKNPREAAMGIKKGTPIRKDLFRPMTEKELILMIRAMEPVKTKAGGWALRALAEDGENGKVDLDRMGVVMGDAINLLSVIHTKEMLDRLKKTPGIGKKDLRRMENAFKAIEKCGQMRFDGWGGEQAFQESVRIVESHRPELEILFSNAWEMDALPRIGGRP
jgi:hypothetical protein